MRSPPPLFFDLLLLLFWGCIQKHSVLCWDNQTPEIIQISHISWGESDGKYSSLREILSRTDNCTHFQNLLSSQIRESPRMPRSNFFFTCVIRQVQVSPDFGVEEFVTDVTLVLHWGGSVVHRV